MILNINFEISLKKISTNVVWRNLALCHRCGAKGHIKHYYPIRRKANSAKNGKHFLYARIAYPRRQLLLYQLIVTQDSLLTLVRQFIACMTVRNALIINPWYSTRYLYPSPVRPKLEKNLSPISNLPIYHAWLFKNSRGHCWEWPILPLISGTLE